MLPRRLHRDYYRYLSKRRHDETSVLARPLSPIHLYQDIACMYWSGAGVRRPEKPRMGSICNHETGLVVPRSTRATIRPCRRYHSVIYDLPCHERNRLRHRRHMAQHHIRPSTICISHDFRATIRTARHVVQSRSPPRRKESQEIPVDSQRKETA